MAFQRDRRFGAWYDPLLQAIPQNTIVGHLVQGDTAGAATATANMLTGGGSGAAPVTVPVSTSPGIFSPGGFVEKNQTVLLLVAAGLAVLLLTGKKRRA